MQGILAIRRATLQLIAKYKLERLFDNLAFRLASWERRMNVALAAAQGSVEGDPGYEIRALDALPDPDGMVLGHCKPRIRVRG
jgi:hypothetical protein